MFSGVLVLLERSLRIDARAWGPHLARFLLMGAIYVAVCYASTTLFTFGAPGLRFFRSITYLNLIFLTLAGIGYFSTVISEEKEEDTLGLMVMAGISPLGLLIGKSFARLIQAMLLVAVQYPFTLLAVTMGGITQKQIRCTYLGIFAYMILVSGVGLLVSTFSQRNRAAAFRLTLFLIGYLLIPSICQTWLPFFVGTNTQTARIVGSISESCVFLQVGTILTSGFNDADFSIQVITNLILGGFCYLLSWPVFELVVRDLSTEAATRGLSARPTGRWKWFSPGRPRLEPFAWKDFHFVGGGLVAVLVRIALYFSLYLFAIAISRGLVIGGLPTGTEATGTYLVLMMFAIALDAALVVSRALHEEIRGQTLATLIMTPTTTGRILYAKVIGALLVWLPAPVFLIMGIAWLPNGAESVRVFFTRDGGPALWLVAHLVLIPHAASVAATFVRWGALPLGIGIAIASAFLTGSFFSALRVGDNDLIVFIVAFLVFSASACCHVAVWIRTEALATR